MSFVYKSDPVRGRQWAEVFAREAPQLPFRIWPDIGDPEKVRFLAAWEPPANILELFPNLEVLFSSGAGVDQFDFSTLPPDLPVVRMVEPGIINGMVEYVSWAVLALHRDMLQYQRQQRRAQWKVAPVRPAAQCRVGVLGLGSLGQAALAQLHSFGFDCAGWSRSRHALDGVQCFAGADELPAFLARTHILVCLLPLTAETRGFLNRVVRAAAARRGIGPCRTRPATGGARPAGRARQRPDRPRPCSTSPTPNRCRPSTRSGSTRTSGSRRTSPA